MSKIIGIITIILALTTNVLAASLTPTDILNSLNLRTIRSSLSNNLGYYCASYLSEIFAKSSITSTDNTLIIDSSNRHLEFAIINENTLLFKDKIKTGTYNTQSEITISTDKQHGDIRSHEIFIKIPSPCEPYPLQQ